MTVWWSDSSGTTTQEIICGQRRLGDAQGSGRVWITTTAIWYAAVVVAWVMLIDSGWLVLWGPGTSWHRWVFFVSWGSLTLRRVLCDLAAFGRRYWWGGYGACADDTARAERAASGER